MSKFLIVMGLFLTTSPFVASAGHHHCSIEHCGCYLSKHNLTGGVAPTCKTNEMSRTCLKNYKRGARAIACREYCAAVKDCPKKSKSQ